MPKTDHRKELTKTMIDNLKPAKKGQRYQRMDSRVPGFGVRVTDAGTKTFILRTRYPGSDSPSRRELGRVGVISLADAREKAGKWRTLVDKGIDPAVQEEAERAEQLRKRKITFRAVAEDFENIKLVSERKGADAKREIDLDLMPEWESLPITEITKNHVINVIQRKAVKRKDKNGRKIGGKIGARNLLALIKRFFRWAVDRHIYGLVESPCESLSASKILGEEVTNSRERVLTPDEIWAFWQATGDMPYPTGPAYRLLLLAALRLSEAAKMQRKELDPLVLQGLDARKNDITWWRDLPGERSIWTIPAARMKGKNSGKKKARDHIVPMTDEIMDLFASLPQFAGDCLFSTTKGRVPVSIGTKVKAELDGRMLVKLRELAVSRGQDPKPVKLPHWVNHDLRRTARSHLSDLRVEEVVRERILAHARKGIEGTYDLHDYREQKRRALEMWAARLRSIVEPAPSNVVALRGAS